MIDTIKIHIHFNQLPNDFYEQMSGLFKNEKLTKKKDTGEIWGTCTFHNFFCSTNTFGLSISGSIAKYFYGTNQYTINKDDFEKAINRLSQELNVDLKKCSVTRLDLAENIITQRPVDNYYRYFGEAKGLTRYNVGEGLEYRNSVRTISIYDKGKECRKNNVPIIPMFQGKNTLRFEVRYMGGDQVGKIINNPKPKVMDIIDKFDFLATVWLKGFKNIFKNYDLMVFQPEAFIDGKQFEKQLVIAGINALGGGQYILEIIKEARKSKLFKGHRNTATNLTHKIKTILHSPILTRKSTMVDELEKKVKIVEFVSSLSDF